MKPAAERGKSRSPTTPARSATSPARSQSVLPRCRRSCVRFVVTVGTRKTSCETNASISSPFSWQPAHSFSGRRFPLRIAPPGESPSFRFRTPFPRRPASTWSRFPTPPRSRRGLPLTMWQGTRDSVCRPRSCCGLPGPTSPSSRWQQHAPDVCERRVAENHLKTSRAEHVVTDPANGAMPPGAEGAMTTRSGESSKGNSGSVRCVSAS